MRVSSLICSSFEGSRALTGLRSGAKMAFIGIRVEVSRPTRLLVLSAIANATRRQYFATASELASCSRCRAAEWASTPSSRMSVSASASVPSVLTRPRRNHDSISASFDLGSFPAQSGDMCNLYSLTKGQAAIRNLFRTRRDRTGNLPLFPAIFPDQLAPIVRAADDARARDCALGHARSAAIRRRADHEHSQPRKSPLAWVAGKAKSLRCPRHVVLRIRRHRAAQDPDVVCAQRGTADVCFRRPMDALARRSEGQRARRLMTCMSCSVSSRPTPTPTPS